MSDWVGVPEKYLYIWPTPSGFLPFPIKEFVLVLGVTWSPSVAPGSVSIQNKVRFGPLFYAHGHPLRCPLASPGASPATRLDAIATMAEEWVVKGSTLLISRHRVRAPPHPPVTVFSASRALEDQMKGRVSGGTSRGAITEEEDLCRVCGLATTRPCRDSLGQLRQVAPMDRCYSCGALDRRYYPAWEEADIQRADAKLNSLRRDKEREARELLRSDPRVVAEKAQQVETYRADLGLMELDHRRR